MTDLQDIPFAERTPKMVRDWYHKRYPLLAAAYQVVVQFNGSDSIHDPMEGGFNTLEVARAALVFTGMPPRCQDDINFADAWIAKLQAEMVTQCPPPAPNIADAVVAAEFPWAGAVVRPEEFADLSAELRDEHVQAVAGEIWEHTPADRMRVLFTQTLGLALPAIYSEISADDEARRRRRGIGIAPEGGAE